MISLVSGIVGAMRRHARVPRVRRNRISRTRWGRLSSFLEVLVPGDPVLVPGDPVLWNRMLGELVPRRLGHLVLRRLSQGRLVHRHLVAGHLVPERLLLH